jgi:hypothetical protein
LQSGGQFFLVKNIINNDDGSTTNALLRCRDYDYAAAPYV